MTTAPQDYLKEDPIIVNQEWCVISIVNPKDKVTTKTMHYMNNFLVDNVNKTILAQGAQMAKKLSAIHINTAAAVTESLKNSINEDDQRVLALFQSYAKKMVIDEDSYLDECRREYSLDDEDLLDRYNIYLSDNRTSLDTEFESIHGNMVSVRGIKNRGNYGKFADAEKRAKFVRGIEPAIHVFVAPVGKWCPVDFDADEVQDQDYMSSELNTLMAKYHENMDNKNIHFEQRKNDMISNTTYQKQDVKDKLRAKIAEKEAIRKRS